MAKGVKTGGRKKGTPNKLTGDVRAMILGALEDVGGRKYLVTQAKQNPTAFLTLVGKVLPMQVTGKDGGPIETSDMTLMELARRIAFDRNAAKGAGE